MTTTDASVRTLNCAQCAGCVLGPAPELKQITVEAWSYLTGVPTPMTVRVPVCFCGRTYPKSGHAVCEIVQKVDK